MKRIILVSMLTLACASAGVQVKREQVQDFQKGKTTWAEMVQRLGNPTSVAMSSDGTRVATYVYTHVQARASSFIPVVGVFAGGADQHTNTAIFRFDPAGQLIDYTMSEGNIGSGANLASNGPQSMPSAAQPVRAQEPTKAKEQPAAMPGCSSSLDCDGGAICYEGACRR